MKNNVKAFVFFIIMIGIFSCEEDEGLLPAISFKMDSNHLSRDTTLAGGSTILIGINAAKTEDKDVLKKFNISKSVNGAAPNSVYDKDLTGSEGDTFSYDFTTQLDTIHGQTNKYTFTVINRDGLTNQLSLTVTIQ